MKKHTEKLSALQRALGQIVKDAETGKLTKAEAADRIISIRESIDKLIKQMRMS